MMDVSRLQRAGSIALLSAVIFLTSALTTPLALWQKGLISVAVSLVLWPIAGQFLVRTMRGTARFDVKHLAGERDELPERIAAHLDAPMTVLGIVFLLLVVAESVVRVDAYRTPFQVASWVIWGAFAVEFLIRLWAAPSAGGYIKRNWWQVAFLVLPFLRFVRLLRIARLTRAGRVLSSAVRSLRSATRTLTSRIGWLVAIHVIVVLAASQLLFEFGGIDSYADSLAATALSAVAGEPTGGTTTVARVMDIALAAYAAVMFAALAGILAAFFLERRREGESMVRQDRPGPP